jgi:hypothetical protein
MLGTGTPTYTATSSPGGLTGTGSGSPLIVTGLTNGTAYTFTVTASNPFGSATSASSNSVTPSGAPGTPAAPTASLPSTYGNTTASVSWVAPSNNGSAITDYVVQYSSDSGGSWTTFADGISTSTSTTVTGLTNGVSYIFRVAAVNGAGTGNYSASSNSVTPLAGKLPTPTGSITETTSTIPICYDNWDETYTYNYYDYNFAPNDTSGSCQGWTGLGENVFRETYVYVSKYGWANSDSAYFSETTNVTPPVTPPVVPVVPPVVPLPGCTCCVGVSVSEGRCIYPPAGPTYQVRTGVSYDGSCGASGGSGTSCSGACTGCSCPVQVIWGDWVTQGGANPC